MADSLKRPRRSSTHSHSSSECSTSSLAPKLWRASSPSPADSTYTCSLPPTCSSSPVSFANSTSYALHYQAFHSHVCQAPPTTYAFAQSSEEKGKRKSEVADDVCGRIFPDQNLLDVHLRECHDPVTQVLQQRGEKTFECLDKHRGCLKKFSTPKNRRLHLIVEHGYPKEWFFGVTIWGIGDVLERGRHGMVRKDWTPRPGQPHYGPDRDKEDNGSRDDEDDVRQLDEARERERGETAVNDMDELVKGLQGTSIKFVPRSVTSKRKQPAAISNTDMSIESSDP